jgi:hypothetical protein
LERVTHALDRVSDASARFRDELASLRALRLRFLRGSFCALARLALVRLLFLLLSRRAVLLTLRSESRRHRLPPLVPEANV